MKVKFDFTLSQRFSVVERTVFELVLRGLTSAKQISSIMWVFSDELCECFSETRQSTGCVLT